MVSSPESSQELCSEETPNTTLETEFSDSLSESDDDVVLKIKKEVEDLPLISLEEVSKC